MNNGKLVAHRRVGFRSCVFVNRQFGPQGEPLGYTGKPRLFYRVNGVEMFARGANFITTNMLESRATTEQYWNLLQSIADANMNLLRINGDVNYFKPAFYDIADELGVLLHHEFMLSDTDYTMAVQSSNGFLPNVRAEVEHQVRRLAHHPCVAMWVSNNEIMPGGWTRTAASSWYTLFVDTVMDAVLRNDVSRPIWPTSASDGWSAGVDNETQLLLPGHSSSDLVVRCANDSSTCGSGMASGGREAHNYYFENAKGDGFDTSMYPDLSYASEFGWSGMISFESLRSFSNESDWYFNSPMINRSIHKAHHTSVHMPTNMPRHMSVRLSHEQSNEQEQWEW